MTERRRRGRRWLLIGAAVVVLLFAGGASFLYWPRSPTAISEQDALEQFRGGATVPPSGAGPAAGVYAYDADGTEKISIGPLPLPTRDIPGTVTVVVRPAEAGCWTSTLNLMGEHTEATTWCTPTAGGLVLQRQSKQEKVPGFDVAAETTCDPGTVVATATDPGTTEVRCTLVMDVSGLKLTVDLAGTATVEPGGDVVVDGTTVATRHVVLAMAATGDLSGHWDEEHWLTDDLLPVRIVRDVVLDGPGRFDEHTTLVLRSLGPQT
jgi:hypothetical protein